jgi:hypothetical protein
MKKKQRHDLKESIATPYGPLELRALSAQDFFLIWHRHKRLFDQVVAEHARGEQVEPAGEVEQAVQISKFIGAAVSAITLAAGSRVPHDEQSPLDAHRRHSGIEPE